MVHKETEDRKERIVRGTPLNKSPAHQKTPEELLMEELAAQDASKAKLTAPAHIAQEARLVLIARKHAPTSKYTLHCHCPLSNMHHLSPERSNTSPHIVAEAHTRVAPPPTSQHACMPGCHLRTCRAPFAWHQRHPLCIALALFGQRCASLLSHPIYSKHLCGIRNPFLFGSPQVNHM